MAPRFGHKPDPAIKQNVRRTRDLQARRTDPRAIIAMASVTATLVASTVFIYQGAPVTASAQTGATTQAVTAAASQSTGNTSASVQNGLLAVPTVAPLSLPLATGSGSQSPSTTQSAPSSQTPSTQAQLPHVSLPSVSAQLPAPITRTRSSR